MTGPAELAINNHDATATGTSPFFIIYRYYINPVYIKEDLRTIDLRTLKEKGEAIVQKLVSVVD